MLIKMREKMKRTDNEKGFTLIEILVVVAIIGILAAIAIPTYSGIQDRAKTKVGEANAAMLNRGVQQLIALESTVAAGTYSHTDDAKELGKLLGLDEVDYVKANDGGDEYEADPAFGTLKLQTP